MAPFRSCIAASPSQTRREAASHCSPISAVSRRGRRAQGTACNGWKQARSRTCSGWQRGGEQDATRCINHAQRGKCNRWVCECEKVCVCVSERESECEQVRGGKCVQEWVMGINHIKHKRERGWETTDKQHTNSNIKETQAGRKRGLSTRASSTGNEKNHTGCTTCRRRFIRRL